MKLIVFVSTGRCGTQFFADALAQAGGDRAVVTHEPLDARYAPKQTLRARDLDALLPHHPPVKEHFDDIVRITEEGKLYVETGWPVFTWIPWLLERFGDEALVVHLVRHPVRFAYSLASHGFYTPELRGDAYIQLAELHPSDPGVKHASYAGDWESLNPAEKSLFQWLEINAWAEELKAAEPGRFITLRSEDALSRPELLRQALVAHRPELADVFSGSGPSADAGTVDEIHLRIGFEIGALRYPPEVTALAESYGYSMEVEEESLTRRFSRNLRRRGPGPKSS
jgi:hypothetical protein